MTFCSIVGHARRQTAGPMGPSTIERSNFCDFLGGGPGIRSAAVGSPISTANGTADFPTKLRDHGGAVPLEQSAQQGARYTE